MKERTRVRDQFYRGVRGTAWAESPDMKVDLEMAVSLPGRLRIELSGPLGVKVGLLLLNDEWFELFIPREKTLFRFPTSELKRDTERREAFFRLVPFRVDPDLFVTAVATRTEIPDGFVSCRFDEAKNAYGFHYRFHGGARHVWLDPTSAAPVEILSFRRHSPPLDAAELRPDWRVVYSDFRGQGPATLPAHMEFHSPVRRELLFEWGKAEAWPNPAMEAFEWDAPAGVTVRDY